MVIWITILAITYAAKAIERKNPAGFNSGLIGRQKREYEHGFNHHHKHNNCKNIDYVRVVIGSFFPGFNYGFVCFFHKNSYIRIRLYIYKTRQYSRSKLQ
jgi:hypothetical protein